MARMTNKCQAIAMSMNNIWIVSLLLSFITGDIGHNGKKMLPILFK